MDSEISYENEKYVQDKLAKFAQILRILNNKILTNFGLEIFKNKSI